MWRAWANDHSLTANFALASIPIEIPMAGLYRDVAFPPSA